MAVAVYTKSGSKSATPVKLDKDIFNVEAKSHDLLKKAYLAYLANGRLNSAKARTRGLVRGGGAKPHRQKGTGRARSGSSRNPLWTGGGVIFGPTGIENYSIKISSAQKKQALKQALSLASKENRIIVVDGLVFSGKVKPTVQLLKKIGADGQVLIVVSKKDDLSDYSTRNLPKVKITQANYISVFDVLNSDTLIISRDSLDLIQSHFGENK